ncbi:uncharacterized protein THITE_111974 [Thermothielavioides terrestris NRRL 8126]|uniref:Uncharacterized protein n=1 Tax=Thermothielavioides terrestris (strain ATCC 38088 / NRRL 8126) TaxID=578455 RepID=G2R1R6_THETT|nr:uncharacterized protein THITE_111974 [Thermothielavioides terrestris NRRL 8126]AEO64893.1 hypothetical protein THITE_111974 [Thermothielavioides terrestris NRRL 8126]
MAGAAVTSWTGVLSPAGTICRRGSARRRDPGSRHEKEVVPEQQQAYNEAAQSEKQLSHAVLFRTLDRTHLADLTVYCKYFGRLPARVGIRRLAGRLHSQSGADTPGPPPMPPVGRGNAQCRGASQDGKASGGGIMAASCQHAAASRLPQCQFWQFRVHSNPREFPRGFGKPTEQGMRTRDPGNLQAAYRGTLAG